MTFFHFLAVQHERVNCNANIRNTNNVSRFLTKNVNEKRNSIKTCIKVSHPNSAQNLSSNPVVADSTTSPIIMGAPFLPTTLSLSSTVPSFNWNSSLSSLYSHNYYAMNQITSNTFSQMTRLIFSTGIVNNIYKIKVKISQNLSNFIN